MALHIINVLSFRFAKFFDHGFDFASNLPDNVLVREIGSRRLVNQVGVHQRFITLGQRTQSRDQIVSTGAGLPSERSPSERRRENARRARPSPARNSARVSVPRVHKETAHRSQPPETEPRDPTCSGRSFCALACAPAVVTACCRDCKRYGQSLGQSSVTSRCSPQHCGQILPCTAGQNRFSLRSSQIAQLKLSSSSIRLFHGSCPLEARAEARHSAQSRSCTSALMQSENRIAPITDFYLSTDA